VRSLQDSKDEPDVFLMNKLTELIIQLRLGFGYWTSGCARLDAEVEAVLHKLAETVADRFELLQMEVTIFGLGRYDSVNDWSEAKERFEALGVSFKRTLRDCVMKMTWRFIVEACLLMQDDVEYDLRCANPGWNLDWLSGEGPSSRGRGFPSRKVVGRAFLDGRRPFNTFSDMDGWREDTDGWGLGIGY
jgi:hypothetical protein